MPKSGIKNWKGGWVNNMDIKSMNIKQKYEKYVNTYSVKKMENMDTVVLEDYYSS